MASTQTRKPLTAAQIQQLWVREGGSRDWATTMAQIAGRESSGKYWVNNAGLNKNGTVDHGLFQINDIWRNDPVIQRIGWQNRYDPVANTKMAVRVFQAQGPKAWATYQGHVANVPTTGGIPGGAQRAPAAQTGATGATGGTGGTTTTRTTTTPGVDNSQLRRSLIANFLGSGGVKSTQATQSLAAGWLTAQDVPGTSTTATTTTPGRPAPRAPRAPASGHSQGHASLPSGTAHFDGKPVAAWIAPILQYARAHGWKGTVNEGVRSNETQTRYYNEFKAGLRAGPVAPPGTSHHRGTVYPLGAVDVSDSAQLSEIIRRSPFAGRLQWAGAKDPPHFSHPFNGGY